MQREQLIKCLKDLEYRLSKVIETPYKIIIVGDAAMVLNGVLDSVQHVELLIPDLKVQVHAALEAIYVAACNGLDDSWFSLNRNNQGLNLNRLKLVPVTILDGDKYTMPEPSDFVALEIVSVNELDIEESACLLRKIKDLIKTETLKNLKPKIQSLKPCMYFDDELFTSTLSLIEKGIL